MSAADLDYTYPAIVTNVKLVKSSGSYPSKGEAQQSERLEITVEYKNGGHTDAFSIGTERKEEFIAGTEVEVILRVPGAGKPPKE